MEDLTFANLQVAGVVILAVIAILISLDKGFDVIQKWRGVKAKQHEKKELGERLNKIENRINQCEKRLEKGDEKFTSTEEDSKHMLVALNAMLMHMISGNDHEKLKAVKAELDTYMATRR